MNLNTTTGEFEFEKWNFSPNIKLDEVVRQFSADQIKLTLANEEWSTYKLNISDRFIFRIIFFSSKIKFIEIYPDDDTMDAIFDIIRKLGGQMKYSWGKVEVNNDIKAGYVSVLITYN